MNFKAWRRSLLTIISVVSVGLSTTQVAPQAVAVPFEGIPGNAPNGTYGFDANPDMDADPVWESSKVGAAGQGGYDCYRIPALNTAKDGTLLASFDGRPRGCGDAPTPNSIVQRSSSDNGQTWSDVTDIASGVSGSAKKGYSDPSYLVDRETGTIFNFHVKTFDAGLISSQRGTDPNARNVLHAAYAKSTDGGQTWSYDHVITRDITAEPTWRSRFSTSGNGIQLQYGEHKGRLIQPAMVIVDGAGWKANAWLSDDHGETWYPSKPWGSAMDENKIVELSNGVLMNNSRSSRQGDTARKISYSYDGGYTWTQPRLDPQLPDPRNNASIIRAFPNAPENSALAKVLLFSNSATTGPVRTNGTIRMSCDDGQTWPVAKEFNAGDTQYTIMTTLKNGDIGILWEDNIRPATNIYYARFNLAWLGASCLHVANEERNVVAGETSTFPVTITNSTTREIFQRPLQFEAPAGWELSADPAVVSLEPGEAKTVQLTVTPSRLGTNGEQRIRLFLADGRVNAVGMVKVELSGGNEGTGVYWNTTVAEPTAFVTITNPKSRNEWHVGDTVHYEFAVVNSGSSFSNRIEILTPGVESNLALDNFVRPAKKNCNWSEFSDRLGKCPFASHTITEEDLARGYFETETNWRFIDLANRNERTQKLMTPRVIVVRGSANGGVTAPDYVKADIEAVGEVSSNDATDGTLVVPVKVHATANTQEFPAATTMELFLDGRSVGSQPVVGGVANFNVTVPAIGPGKESVVHRLVARPNVSADNFRGLDGTATVTVIAANKTPGRIVLTLGELSDLQSGTVPDNQILVSAKYQRNGAPVAGQEVSFTTSSGHTALGVTNAEGVAVAFIEVAELGQSQQQNVAVSVTARVAGMETDAEIFDAAEAVQTFTVTPPAPDVPAETPTPPAPDVPETQELGWGAILGIVIAALAGLGLLAAGLINHFAPGLKFPR